MTEPIQAQIDAAREQYKKAYANLGGVGMACFLSNQEQEKAFQTAFERLARAAQSYVPMLEALTAAAEVGSKCVAEHMGGERCVGRCLCSKDCCETPLPFCAATIERCAQKAKEWLGGGIDGEDCANAIRALANDK